MKWVWLYKQGAAHWLAGTVILKSCQFPRAPAIACWSELWRSDDNYLVWVVSSHNDSSSWQPLGLLVSPPMIIAHPKFSHSAAKVLPVNNATKRVGAVSGGNGARNPDCLTRRLSATTLQTPTESSKSLVVESRFIDQMIINWHQVQKKPNLWWWLLHGACRFEASATFMTAFVLSDLYWKNHAPMIS